MFFFCPQLARRQRTKTAVSLPCNSLGRCANIKSFLCISLSIDHYCSLCMYTELCVFYNTDGCAGGRAHTWEAVDANVRPKRCEESPLRRMGRNRLPITSTSLLLEPYLTAGESTLVVPKFECLRLSCNRLVNL